MHKSRRPANGMFCKNNKNWQKNGKLKNEKKTANHIRITNVRIMFSFASFFLFEFCSGMEDNNFFRKLHWISICEKYFTRFRLVLSFFCSKIGICVHHHAQGPFACWSHYGNNVFCSRTLRWLWLLGIERLSFTHQFVILPIPMNFICAARWNSFVVCTAWSLVGCDECVCSQRPKAIKKISYAAKWGKN